MRDRFDDIVDADMAGDSAKSELLRELDRLMIDPDDCSPDVCPGCGGELKEGGGYVGETVVYCDADGCKVGIVWEDSAAAIAAVF
jgi:hypothetical protein